MLESIGRDTPAVSRLSFLGQDGTKAEPPEYLVDPYVIRNQPMYSLRTRRC